MTLGSGKGALKLKGGDLIEKKKKRKKKNNSSELVVVGESEADKRKETAEGVVLPPPEESFDKRTAAERRYDEQLASREAQRIAKMASKSHRQRVAEFNAHLGSLTEHMDIPKVGPG